ncbi:5-formyltetrahydrofolate cyclo-ligase [Rhodovulum marinum]|uniref:5-formyltetrahydrofolate cyclo-ligase n=1 Tax=Rhodovulum marinum TaxID=320662 RepID=A0A4R2PWS9_9RHOB|nr:5-formyltetrahydrofolate cyclo-ligase [Rhodovulum marinum]TCP38611.1 5-formyltetrahydrofolate cyclo-ligase [Rhodovulum marinum]
MNDQDKPAARFASPPCMAGEIAPDYFNPLGTDSTQARDVARWRRAERARLRGARGKIPVAEHRRTSQALAGHLLDLLSNRFGGARGRVLSGYWPIKGEPDLRAALADLHDAGVMIALPIVEEKAAPLVFRRWAPTTRMVLGDWNIPVPPAKAARVTPAIMLAPLMGWDGAGYRLGYGGGYFDRTLAALSPRPATIGIGFQSAQLATIYPQPHDIALDFILTEAGVQVTREAP